jgi:hypothetical protein
VTGRIWPVVVAGVVLGFVAGALIEPTWQDVIEPAQVLAGVVHYPPDNPVYLYSVRTWTILHQLTALAIAAGIPERTLAIFVSGAIGALAFTALGLTTRAMGAPTLVAALSPILIYTSGITRLLPGYPVIVLGWPYTYGLTAHGLLLLLVALLGLRRDRAAALVIGLFPCVHPGVAIWVWIIVAGLGIVYRQDARTRLRAVLPWMATGVTVTVVSAVYQWGWIMPDLSATAPPSAELMHGIRQYWDTHRRPLQWIDLNVLVAVVMPLLFVWWQRRAGPSLPREAHWIATAMLIAVGIAVGGDLLIRVLPEPLGAILARPMPRRLLSLPVLGGMAWIIGVCTSRAVPPHVHGLTNWVFAGLAIVSLRTVGTLTMPRDVVRAIIEPLGWDWTLVALTMMALVGVAVVVAIQLGRAVTTRWQDLSARTFRGALVVATAMLLASAVVDGPQRLSGLRDQHNDELLRRTAARPGLLLTGANLHLIQAATRRPVLIDGGALDALIYVPEAATTSDHILREIYDLTLTRPGSREDWSDGVLPDWAGEHVWRDRTVAGWQAIGDSFGVTDILTPSGWSLQLPLVARDDNLALWQIPVR